MHTNIFETKTNDELFVLYNQFIEAEKNIGFFENNELGKIKKEYERDFGTNTVLMLQIELTHTIANRWFTKNEETKKFIKNNAVDEGYLQDWYQNSVLETDTPIWTDEHIAEVYGDFYLIPREIVDGRRN